MLCFGTTLLLYIYTNTSLCAFNKSLAPVVQKEGE